MTDKTSPNGPRPIDDQGTPPEAEGPVIDVEPVKDEDSKDEDAAPSPGGPEPPAGGKGAPALSPWFGIGGLALLVAAGIVVLFLVPWRQPEDMSGFRQQVADRLGALDGRVKTLESAEPPATADVAPLEDRIAKLESAANAPPPASAADLDALRGRIATLEARLTADQEARAALDAKIDAVAASDVGHSANAAMLALSASALDDAIHRGQRFREELALVEKLHPGDPAIDKLAPFADDGIEPLSTLTAAFAKASRAAVDAAKSGAKPQGFWDRVMGFFGGLVVVRDAGVAQNAPAGETLHAMRLALDDGNLPRAVALTQDLPPPSRAAMAPWLARANAHLNALAAASDLRQRVIGTLIDTTLQGTARPTPAEAAAPDAPTGNAPADAPETIPETTPETAQ